MSVVHIAGRKRKMIVGGTPTEIRVGDAERAEA